MSMTEQEYRNRLHKLQDAFDEDKDLLKVEYALSNNPYKIGDILRDCYNIIKVTDIRVARTTIYSEIPECVYLGVQLTEKLVPKKRQDSNQIMLQSNVRQKLN